MPDHPPVRVLTAQAASQAAADHLGEQDYRDIYDELRGKASLRQFVDALHSAYSIGWWSKYERGQVALTARARGELRRAVGLAELPPAVADVIGQVDPDAAVYQVGEGVVERVLLVAAPGTITVRLNSHVEIVDLAPECDVTRLQAPSRPRRRGSIVIDRELWETLNAARLEADLAWPAFLGRLLVKDET